MWVAVAELCSRGASLTAKDDAGDTPLDALLRQCRAHERGQSIALGAVIGSVPHTASGALPMLSPSLASLEGPGAAEVLAAEAAQRAPSGATPPFVGAEGRPPLPADVAEKVAEVCKSRVYRHTAQERLVLLDQFLEACLAQGQS